MTAVGPSVHLTMSGPWNCHWSSRSTLHSLHPRSGLIRRLDLEQRSQIDGKCGETRHRSCPGQRSEQSPPGLAVGDTPEDVGVSSVTGGLFNR
jgi:hypothetical protein